MTELFRPDAMMQIWKKNGDSSMWLSLELSSACTSVIPLIQVTTQILTKYRASSQRRFNNEKGVLCHAYAAIAHINSCSFE